jgi:hypothetical protein
MKLSSAYNTRFPHTCKVYRVSEETPFNDGVETVFYKGECAMYGSSTLRTFKQSGVIKGEYAIDIPKLVKGVNSGDTIDVTDYNGTFEGCIVTNSMPVVYGKFEGTTIYFNLPKN